VICPSTARASCGSSITAPSVTSISIIDGSTRCSASRRRNSVGSRGSITSAVETFTAVRSRSPSSVQRRAWRTTSSKMWTVSGHISSVGSISGMKRSGEIRPRLGCCQRTSASAV
jgi:hypothetical protein